MPADPGCCPVLGETGWGRGRRRAIGSITVSGVACKRASVAAVITARSTVRGSARESAGGSRCAVPVRATNVAAVVRLSTRRGNGLGAYADERK